MDQRALTARSQEQVLMGRLGQVPLLRRLSTRHLQLLRKIAKARVLKDGEVLCRAGEPAQGLYILLKGGMVRRRGGTVLGEVIPIGVAGEIGALTGLPREEEVISTAEGLALHVSGEVLQLVLAKDIELYQRLARNAIEWLSARLVMANDSLTDVARRRADLMGVIDEAQHELNDARMLHSMRH